jgi:hypothetical protein
MPEKNLLPPLSSHIAAHRPAQQPAQPASSEIKAASKKKPLPPLTIINKQYLDQHVNNDTLININDSLSSNLISGEHYTLYFPKIDAIAYTTCYNPSRETAIFHIDEIIHNDPKSPILKRERITLVYASRKHRGMDFDVYMENPLHTELNINPIKLTNYLKFKRIQDQEDARRQEEEEAKNNLEGGKKSRRRKTKRSKKTRRSRR